ncbi:MAG: hypothetical protein FJW35_11895, partial [Acidobacteria bacterium]|nr:hypothetical protein [Acidobacteriota bacterium]
MVLTQAPISATPAGYLPEGILRPGDFERARLILRKPDGAVLILSEGFHSACDPAVSFDGRQVLFAGKREAKDRWDIYRIGIDGQGLQQITRELGDCRNPVYLSALYTLISEKPWHPIAFLSSSANSSGEYDRLPVMNIYSCRMDGTGLMRLTQGPSGDADPFLMDDGRLLFSTWRRRYMDRP